LVITPIEKIGKYGGTVKVFAIDEMNWQDFQYGVGMQEGLYRINKEATNIEMNIAKGYEMAQDFTSFTIQLREGVKWSDGAPFTSDDVVFWFEDIVKQYVDWELLAGDLKDAVKTDDYTVRLDLLRSYPAIVGLMAGWPSWRMYQPKHYLQKWHPDYNPEAEALAKDEGYDTWQQCIVAHYAHVVDLDVPDLNPWILRDLSTTSKFFERNPYYWKVDTAGNQLPYIDNILVSIIDGESYPLKVISGEADTAYIRTSFADYTLYKENESSGEYRVILLPGNWGSDVSVGFNMTHPDPEIRGLFQDVRFRRAMSAAIDRDEINKVAFFGKAVPRQATVFPFVSYYKDEWGKAYAQYDTEMANTLLDQVGLDKRNRDGFRLLPSGKPLEIVIEFSDTQTAFETTLELIKEFWEDVGVKTLIKYLDYNLFSERVVLNDHMARSGWTGACDEISNYTMGGAWFASNGSGLAIAPRWNNWNDAFYRVKFAKDKLEAATDDQVKKDLREQLATSEKELEELTALLPDGDRPPEEYLVLNEWFVQRQSTALGSKEYMELSQKIYDFHAENVWIIGTVGMSPKILIAKNNLRNVETPSHVARGILMFDSTANYFQYFFDN
jgi:peptide/nickel transport system substrate-binding protein